MRDAGERWAMFRNRCRWGLRITQSSHRLLDFVLWVSDSDSYQFVAGVACGNRYQMGHSEVQREDQIEWSRGVVNLALYGRISLVLYQHYGSVSCCVNSYTIAAVDVDRVGKHRDGDRTRFVRFMLVFYRTQASSMNFFSPPKVP